MRWLADENVRADVVQALRSLGHDIENVPHRSTDKEVMKRACAEQRIVLTCDTDFAKITLHPPSQSCGIAVLRVHPPILDQYMLALAPLLSTDESVVKGKTFLLSPKQWIVLTDLQQ